LDIEVDTSWYTPEFVGNQIVFLATSAGYDGFDYLMICDLTSEASQSGYMMSNEELFNYKEQMDAVFTDIDDKFRDSDNGLYDDEDLADALEYLFYTGDDTYLAKLVKANKEVNGEDDYYTEEALAYYQDFANAENDFAAYADYTKTINGKEVHSNSQDYYYTLLGRMTSSDSADLLDSYRSSLKNYPTAETVTWWEGLSTVAKVFFVLGMVGIGLSVIGVGVLFLLQFLVNRKKVDITDDKDIDVYDGDNSVKEN
jgi:hypothetical protein